MRIILILLILSLTALLHAQSSIVYDAGTNLTIESGADVCAAEIIINGTWSGGGTLCEEPLPVTLTAFTSTITSSGRDVTLNWSTSKETNNSGFDVERKVTGKSDWNKITFIAGKGNSNTQNLYTFTDKKLNCGKYNYRLKQIDYNGNYEYYNLIEEVDIIPPKKFSLSQNYPNPFNPVTKIDFELPVDCNVTIKVYDITGRELAVLLNNEFKTADYYTITFDAPNLASGVYFYRLTTDGFIETKSMMLIK